MDDKQQRKSVTGVTLLIVGAVCLVIVTILYNAIAGKHAYDAAQQASTVPASAASTVR